MDIVNNVVSKAKEIYAVTSDKVGEVIDTSKLKVKSAQINSKITKDYETLGRMYYQSVKDGDMDADAFDELVEQIDIKQEELEEIEDQINAQKGVVVCECGAKNAMGSVYCNACGKKLDQDDSEHSADQQE